MKTILHNNIHAVIPYYGTHEEKSHKEMSANTDVKKQLRNSNRTHK